MRVAFGLKRDDAAKLVIHILHLPFEYYHGGWQCCYFIFDATHFDEVLRVTKEKDILIEKVEHWASDPLRDEMMKMINGLEHHLKGLKLVLVQKEFSANLAE